MLIDLHVHSYLSRECTLKPKDVLERAESHGLDGVAFTETNTQDGCDELIDLAAHSKLKVFVGLELATDRGQYLCFFEDPMRAPEPVQLWGSNREKAWNADECLAKIHGLGAAIVAARPFDRETPNAAFDYLRTLKTICAVEVYNPRVRAGANEAALETALEMKLKGVAGSDAKKSLDEIGFAATLFRTPVNTQKELVQALKTAPTWPVMMGELPRMQRPGEAKQQEKEARKKKRRRPWFGAPT